MLSYIASLLLIATSFASSDITFTCTSIPGDLSVDTISVNGAEYHMISLEGFSLPTDGIEFAGLPSLPRVSSTFLLPPDTRIDSIEVLSSTWESIPGKYYLYPAQSGLLADTSFTPPDLEVYNSCSAFPLQPVEVSRQGSAMGYSVATLSGTAIKYLPADSSLFVLTSLTLDIRTEPSESEQIIPNRETVWSAAMRERGIISLVSNPVNITGYQQPVSISFSDRTTSLAVTQSPSSEGDGVDMVIITGEELAGPFEQVAEYRTQQGIVTVVRTTEWINQFYSGTDLPQKIRNFIRDAHIEWGIQAVLLGGDSEVVPVRECNGWDYIPRPFPTYQLPSDDYYADIDGNWSFNGSEWSAESSTNYLDLCIGRWPVNTSDDIDLMFTKLKIYEQPEEYPGDFARKVLLIGSNNPSGTGADDMIDLVTQLMKSVAIPEYLDNPTELYYPHSLPGEGLCRNTAVNQFDQGYGLIIHADHSEIHKLATAGKGTLGQYMWDSDFSTMENTSRPSILWTLGCDTGHFDGAFSFSEAGLLTSRNTGMVAVIANSRGGLHSQKITAYALFDALFNTGWIGDQFAFQSLHWPLSYLGEANRSSKN
ncbi:MAG: C25 family cysteine peptidase, partial [Candidatus Thorarchaeota archaeon]